MPTPAPTPPTRSRSAPTDVTRHRGMMAGSASSSGPAGVARPLRGARRRKIGTSCSVSLLDALYQTVTTVTTVGFREVQPLTPRQMFTIALILTGVGTALYTLGSCSGVMRASCTGGDAWTRPSTGPPVTPSSAAGAVSGPSIASAPAACGPCGRHRPGRARACRLPARRTIVGDATDDDVLARGGRRRAASAVVAALDHRRRQRLRDARAPGP